MVGANTPPSDASFLRKLRKPMVEKKRRDRMNISIDNLKAILAKSSKNPASVVKMDKAEILELAVTHLVKLQQSQDTSLPSEESFRAGFRACTRETINYLNSSTMMPVPHLRALDNHLCYVGDTTSHKNGFRMSSASSFPVQRNRSSLSNNLRSIPRISPLCWDSHFSTLSYADIRGDIMNSPLDGSSFFSSTNRSFSPCSVPSPALSFCSSGSESSTCGLSFRTDTGSDSAEQDDSKNDIVLGHMIKEEKPWRPW